MENLYKTSNKKISNILLDENGLYNDFDSFSKIVNVYMYFFHDSGTFIDNVIMTYFLSNGYFINNYHRELFIYIFKPLNKQERVQLINECFTNIVEHWEFVYKIKITRCIKKIHKNIIENPLLITYC